MDTQEKIKCLNHIFTICLINFKNLNILIHFILYE